jgi:multicomponent K+:H+ antiporter subunit E
MVLVFWLLMSDSFSVGLLLLGAILGVVIPLFAARIDREFARIGTLRPVPKLLVVTLWDILVSNIEVARQVLGRESRIHPGFVWIPLDIGNIHGIAALTSMITLTPGTVSAALSDDRKYLLVHVLNLDDPEHLIAEIKRRYEAPLMEIFP